MVRHALRLAHTRLHRLVGTGDYHESIDLLAEQHATNEPDGRRGVRHRGGTKRPMVGIRINPSPGLLATTLEGLGAWAASLRDMLFGPRREAGAGVGAIGDPLDDLT